MGLLWETQIITVHQLGNATRSLYSVVRDDASQAIAGGKKSVNSAARKGGHAGHATNTGNNGSCDCLVLDFWVIPNDKLRNPKRGG